MTRRDEPRFQYILDAINDELPSGRAMHLAYAVLFAFSLPLLAWGAAWIIKYVGMMQ